MIVIYSFLWAAVAEERIVNRRYQILINIA